MISIEARLKNNVEMCDFSRHTVLSVPDVQVASHALVPRILRNIDQRLLSPEDFDLPAQGRLDYMNKT